MSVYFELSGIKLPAYGTMAFLGLLVSVAIAFYYARLYSIHMIDVVNCICYGGLGLITGAKLFYALPFLPEIYEMIKSDGISDFLPDTRIAEILSSERKLEIVGKQLIDEAIVSHKADNATVMLIPLGR